MRCPHGWILVKSGLYICFSFPAPVLDRGPAPSEACGSNIPTSSSKGKLTTKPHRKRGPSDPARLKDSIMTNHFRPSTRSTHLESSEEGDPGDVVEIEAPSDSTPGPRVGSRASTGAAPIVVKQEASDFAEPDSSVNDPQAIPRPVSPTGSTASVSSAVSVSSSQYWSAQMSGEPPPLESFGHSDLILSIGRDGIEAYAQEEARRVVTHASYWPIPPDSAGDFDRVKLLQALRRNARYKLQLVLSSTELTPLMRSLQSCRLGVLINCYAQLEEGWQRRQAKKNPGPSGAGSSPPGGPSS